MALQVYNPSDLLFRKQVNQWLSNSAVNPMAWPYNAKFDGVTDDAAAVQAAVDAAILRGGDVYMPPGACLLGSTINLSNVVKIIGSGLGTRFIPTSDSIGTVFNVTGARVGMSGFLLDASSIASPTFTGVKVDTSGLFKLQDAWIYGAGTGIDFPQGNACDFLNLRIQQCPIGILSGGVFDKFPGDTVWQNMVVIPTSTGIAWIMDGNTNAQTMTNCKLIGGAKNLWVRGTGGGSTGGFNSIPDGIFITSGNFTQTTSYVMQVTKAFNIAMDATTFIGAGEIGLLIDPASQTDVDGITLQGTKIRANLKEGVRWDSGANFTASGAQIYGNSQAASGTYSNIYVDADATGLCQVTGCMLGYSKAGVNFANIEGPAKYGIELAAGSLATSGDFLGGLQLVGNTFTGNTTGTYLDNSVAPSKEISGNLV